MSRKGFNHPMHSYNENSITGFAILENTDNTAQLRSSYQGGPNNMNRMKGGEKPTPKGYGDLPHDSSMPQPPKGN